MTALRAVLITSIVAFPSFAFAEVVLVAPGDDISAAIAALVPGDELVFGAGTYDLGQGLVGSLDGSAAAPIIVRGNAGAILEAPDGAFTLRLEGSNFIVENLEIRGPQAALTLLGEDIIVRDSAFSGASAGIACEDCAQTVIEGCEFQGMTHDAGAAIYSEAFVNGAVHANWIHDVAGDGIVLTGRTVNSDISDNIVESVGRDGIHVELPAELAVGAPNSIAGNYVTAAGGSGILTHGGVSTVSNIVSDFATAGIHSTLGMTTTDAIIAHNTVVGSDNCFIGTEWSLSAAALTVVANNAFYCGTGSAIYFADGVGMNIQVTGNMYLGAADFPGDSLLGEGLSDFVDAPTGDYYPSANSPLIDAGTPAFTTNIDFNGTLRDASPDIGAYESAGAMNPGATPGGDFKGGAGSSASGDDADAADAGTGSSGGLNGGASGFPERDSGCNCSSTSSSAPLFPLLLVALIAFRPRRR